MRHVAVGRHARYPDRPSWWSYVIILLAAVAALVASLTFASQFAPAQALPAARQAPVILAARGAGSAGTDGLAAQLARVKTVAARLAAVRVRAAATTAALTYTVRPGDSMSAVAAGHCGQARDWTGIYAASRARGWTAANANVLATGQHLWLSCSYLPSMLRFAPAPPPPPAPARVVTAVTYHGTYHRAYYHRSYTAAVSGTYHGSGSMEQCIISRESGGNSQVMNSSGHYGLYQFSESTWVGSGGSAADFGHASVAEQQRVFQNAVAARGYSDWAPYDGC